MKHIIEEYNQKTNRLIMEERDYSFLQSFLLNLGVRARVCEAWVENGIRMVDIQAENVYKTAYILDIKQEEIDELLSSDGVRRWQI